MVDKENFEKDINVPGKEQIMIDGVNVSECKHYEYKSLKDCEMRYPESGDCEIGLLNYLFNGNLDIEKYCKDNPNCYFKQLARKTQLSIKQSKELIRLRKELQESTVKNRNLKQECEELKKEIINKNEKIKELRFSVSDLTNRLCCLNAEKSFRIVDLEQTLDGIEKELKEDIYCENQECGCDDFEECLKCTKEHILDIINKAKGKNQ